MDKLIAGFSNQLQKALDIANEYKFYTNRDVKFDNVLIVGMGGSGIGGTIIQNYISDKLNIPLLVSKSYKLPKFVSPNTLLIACSYSGNTEETLSNLYQALDTKCTIVGISSGGKLLDILKQNNKDCIIIPGDFPPRSCLGYSFVQLLRVLNYFNLIDISYQDEILNTISLLDKERDCIKKEAVKIANLLAHKLPIIYAETNMEGVAIRWKQQFNENGKMLCMHNVIPEMNHNELVGWRDIDDSRVAIFLRNENDYERSQKRMNYNIETIKKYTPHIIELYSKGKSYLENAFYLIHLGDWISWYLAQERGFDAMEVYAIDELKEALG